MKTRKIITNLLPLSLIVSLYGCSPKEVVIDLTPLGLNTDTFEAPDIDYEGLGINPDSNFRFAATEPPARSTNPMDLGQFQGAWESECYVERTIYPEPDFQATKVYSKVFYRFAGDRMEREQLRLSDPQCLISMGTSGPEPSIYIIQTDIQIPRTKEDRVFGVTVGYAETQGLTKYQTGENTGEYTNDDIAYRLLYRSEQGLVASRYATSKEGDDDDFTLDWLVTFQYIGEQEFKL